MPPSVEPTPESSPDRLLQTPPSLENTSRNAAEVEQDAGSAAAKAAQLRDDTGDTLYETTHLGGQPGDRIAEVRDDLSGHRRCRSTETPHLRQQTTAAIRSQCIAEVRERLAQAAEGTLHGAELVHDSGDSTDRIAHLTDTLTQTFQEIRVEGVTEAADRVARTWSGRSSLR